MYCAHCGGPVMPEQIFCSKCGQKIMGPTVFDSAAQPGKPLESSPGGTATLQGARPAGTSRVASNVSALGTLWILYSVIRLVPGLGLFALGRMHFPFFMSPFPFSQHFAVGPLLGVLGLFVSAFAIAGIIAGWGLMAHQPWARVLAIILAFINVIHFPLGTGLAVYTFWVLLSSNAEVEYQSMAQAH